MLFAIVAKHASPIAVLIKWVGFSRSSVNEESSSFRQIWWSSEIVYRCVHLLEVVPLASIIDDSVAQFAVAARL